MSPETNLRALSIRYERSLRARARRDRVLWALAALVTAGTAAGLAWLVARARGL